MENEQEEEEFMCEVHVSRSRYVLPSGQRAGKSRWGWLKGLGRRSKAAGETMWSSGAAVLSKSDLVAKSAREDYQLPPVVEVRRMWASERKRKRRQLFARDGYDCWLCGLDLGQDITIEHVKPTSKGGTHKLENLKLAHKACNEMAGDLSLEDKHILREVLHLL